MYPYVQATASGVRLDVLVAPRSRRDAIVGVHDGALKVALTAPPVDGEANAALVAFLAKRLRVARASVRITRGPSSRRKTLELDGVDADAVRALVDAG